MTASQLTEIGATLTGAMAAVSFLLTWAEHSDREDFRHRLLSRSTLIIVAGIISTYAYSTTRPAFGEWGQTPTLSSIPISSKERQALEDVVRSAIFLECQAYRQAPSNTSPDLSQYWVPAEQGGRVAAKITEGTRRLNTNHRTVTRCGDGLAINSTRLFIGDCAEVITSERTALPPHASSLANPYQVVYRLRKADTTWKIEAATTASVARFVGPF